MKSRIFRSIMSVTLGVLLLALALTIGLLYEYFENQNRLDLRNGATFAARGAALGGMDYFQGLEKTDSRVTWIAADGTVLYDSVCDADSLENHLDREEIAEALRSGTGESVRFSATLAKKTCYRAVLLDDGTIVRVSRTELTPLSLALALLPPMLLTLLLAVILSAALSARVSRALVQPINRLDLEHPETADCYEELTPLLSRLSSQKKQIARQLAELRRRQQEFAAITENMGEGLIVVDSRLEVLSCNGSAKRLLGTADACTGGSLLTLSRSEVFRETARHAREGVHYETTWETGGRICRVITDPVRTDEGATGAVILLLDVTEHESRERLRREFSANVSHELKTPLTSISGFAEIIRDGMVRSEDIPRFAGKVYDEAQRLIALVGDIIRLSRLDEGAVGEFEPVELLAVAEAAAARLREQAGKRGVTLSVTGEKAEIFGVRQVIDEIAANLCDNAVKYNIEGGSVRVSVERGAGTVTLAVSDTGIGIPECEQARIFERFYRVDKSHSREIGGTGLGLSIVKHGAAVHGAAIHMESAPGKGTCIQVVFPVKPKKA